MTDRTTVAQGLRALSVRQPFADAILYGGKTHEVRTWQTAYRGPLLIHASSGYNKNEETLIRPRLRQGLRVRSAILGMVTLVSIDRDWHAIPKEVRKRFWIDPSPNAPDDHPDDLEPEPNFWKLADPVVFDEPIPCKGRLNLWTPPPEVVKQLARYLK